MLAIKRGSQNQSFAASTPEATLGQVLFYGWILRFFHIIKLVLTNYKMRISSISSGTKVFPHGIYSVTWRWIVYHFIMGGLVCTFDGFEFYSVDE